MSPRALLPLVILVAVGCGAAPPAAPPPAPIVIGPAPTQSAPEPVATPPVATGRHALTPGSNGPGDAAGMVGDYGQIFPDHPVTLMLVNSAAMRADPLGGRVMQLLTAVFVGWGQFMPLDLIDPLKDLDWVLLSGILVMGNTQKNVYLACYNVFEPRADVISDELVSRLPNGKKTKLGVPGAKPLSAEIDGATRDYVRTKPGLLAIGPGGSGKDMATTLLRAKSTPTFRDTELVRVSFARAQFLPFMVPSGMNSARIWINDRAAKDLVLAAEGDYADAVAAQTAVDDVRNTLRQNVPPLARGFLRPLIEDASIWAEGATLRYEAVLPEPLIAMFTSVVCMRATGNPDCSHP